MAKIGLGPTGKRLTEGEHKQIIESYQDPTMRVIDICESFEIDRKTLYRHLNKEGIPLRHPGLGNKSNHPTKFETALREAAHRQLMGGEIDVH